MDWASAGSQVRVGTVPRVVITPQKTLEPRLYCECYHIVYAMFASRATRTCEGVNDDFGELCKLEQLFRQEKDHIGKTYNILVTL